MNKSSKCRFCKYYRPDERYFGVVGWCDHNDKPSAYEDNCEAFEEGKQHWLCGKEVKE
jgi:hypothetical protein